MSGTVRKRCDCSNAFQDKTYGKQIRVMNKMTKKENAYRCTSCGKER